jgi:hypothetical protein
MYLSIVAPSDSSPVNNLHERAEGVLKFNLSPLRHINLRYDGSVGEQPGGGADPLTRGDMTATTSHHVTGTVLSPPYIRASPRPPNKDSELPWPL